MTLYKIFVFSPPVQLYRGSFCLFPAENGKFQQKPCLLETGLLYSYKCEKYDKGGGPMPGGKHVLGQGKNRIFGTAKVGDRGQIVIPQEARRFYGISPGDTLLILGNEASGLVVTRPEILNDLADEILGKEEHKT